MGHRGRLHPERPARTPRGGALNPAPVTWDPDRYLAHADERGRPFVELVARVEATDPATVVDLGCGPGNLTVLQWVPGHLDLLPGLVDAVAHDGWLAFQVPGNMDEPSHALRRELAARPPYSEWTAGAEEPFSHDPETYLRVLQRAGCDVDAWETTYLHVLHGEDPVLSWISGTSLRPTLQCLPEHLRPRFTDELAALLREAYPASAGEGSGVVLPFRRVFVVARRRSGSSGR